MTDVQGRIVVVLKRAHATELVRKISEGEIADVSSLHDAAVALGANGAALKSVLEKHDYAGVKSAIPNQSRSVKDQIQLESRSKIPLRRSLVGVFAVNAGALSEAQRKHFVTELQSLNTIVYSAYVESSHAVRAHKTPAHPAPSFVSDQTYLNAAPEGIGLQALPPGTRLGGTGVGLAIVDLDVNLHHEALGGADPRVHVGRGHSSVDTDKVHGTAALGVILSRPGKPLTGIAPGAVLKSVAKPGAPDPEALGNAIADAIDAAAADLEEGDVLLIEVQDGDRPVEVNVEPWAAISRATGRGIIVIEAAGNGGFSLEGLARNEPEKCPAWNQEEEPNTILDSGAIIVSGCTKGHEHHRLTASCNYGDRVDCYAIGQYVVSAGATDRLLSLVDTGDKNKWYDNQFFDATSLASAIVAGVVLRFQDMARRTPGLEQSLNAYQIRDLLKSAGTPITADGKQWFMPDLAQMQSMLDGLASSTVVGTATVPATVPAGKTTIQPPPSPPVTASVNR